MFWTTEVEVEDVVDVGVLGVGDGNSLDVLVVASDGSTISKQPTNGQKVIKNGFVYTPR
jgi:hypothetical protein